MKYLDIALAGCLGAMLGLFTGLFMEWNLWLCIPICGFIAFVSYKPMDILNVILANRSLLKEILYKASYLLLMVVTLTVTLLAPMFLLWFWYSGFQLLIFLLVLLMGSFILFVFISPEESVKKDEFIKLLPLANFSSIIIFEKFKEYSLYSSRPLLMFWLIFAILLPLSIIILGLLSPLFLLEFCFGIIVVCSVSKRIAAMIGGLMGGTAGTLCQIMGIPYPWAILLTGITIGFMTGPYLYVLRKKMIEKTTITQPQT